MDGSNNYIQHLFSFPWSLERRGNLAEFDLRSEVEAPEPRSSQTKISPINKETVSNVYPICNLFLPQRGLLLYFGSRLCYCARYLPTLNQIAKMLNAINRFAEKTGLGMHLWFIVDPIVVYVQCFLVFSLTCNLKLTHAYMFALGNLNF